MRRNTLVLYVSLKYISPAWFSHWSLKLHTYCLHDSSIWISNRCLKLSLAKTDLFILSLVYLSKWAPLSTLLLKPATCRGHLCFFPFSRSPHPISASSIHFNFRIYLKCIPIFLVSLATALNQVTIICLLDSGSDCPTCPPTFTLASLQIVISQSNLFQILVRVCYFPA